MSPFYILRKVLSFLMALTFVFQVPAWAQSSSRVRSLYFDLRDQRTELGRIEESHLRAMADWERLKVCLSERPKDLEFGAVCADLAQEFAQSLESIDSTLSGLNYRKNSRPHHLSPKTKELLKLWLSAKPDLVAVRTRLNQEVRAFQNFIESDGILTMDERRPPNLLDCYLRDLQIGRSDEMSAFDDYCGRKLSWLKAKIEFEDDEGLVITSGDDDKAGRTEGRCVGGGCGEGKSSSKTIGYREPREPRGASERDHHESGVSIGRSHEVTYNSEVVESWMRDGAPESGRPVGVSDEMIIKNEFRSFDSEMSPVFEGLQLAMDRAAEAKRILDESRPNSVFLSDLAVRLADTKAKLDATQPTTLIQRSAKDLGKHSYNLGKQALIANQKGEAEYFASFAETMADVALGFTPGISFGKDIYEAVTGLSLVNGVKLTHFERSIAVFGVATLGIGSRAKSMAQVMDRGLKLFEPYLRNSGQVVRELVPMIANSSLGRAIYRARERGYVLDSGSFKFLKTNSALGNPLPKDQVYAKAIERQYAEALKSGTGRLASPGRSEAWITAAEDLRNVSKNDLAKRLALYEDRAGTRLRDTKNFVIVEFKFKNSPDPLIFSPVGQREFGWIPGGRTKGGAREYLVDPEIFRNGKVNIESVVVKEVK